MEFLLQLPPPISFFIVSAVTTFFTLAGLYLVRKKYSADVLKENHEVAAIIFNAFGLFYGVMLAFVVFVTWGGYSDATKDLALFSQCERCHLPGWLPSPDLWWHRCIRPRSQTRQRRASLRKTGRKH